MLKKLLTETRNLIKDPNNWTQGADARSRSGRYVSIHNPSACQFCLVGALSKISLKYEPYDNKLYTKARDLIEKHGNTTAIGSFNDENSHKTVIETLNKAINSL